MFGEVVPALATPPERGDPVSAARLAWSYRCLLDFRAWHAASWPADEPFDEVVERLHAYGAARGWASDELAEIDYDLSAEFEAQGDLSAARAHLGRVLERYPPGTPHRAHLLVTLASYARHCREFDRAGDLLELVEGELGDPAGDPIAAEARILWHLERTTYLIGIGLQDLAAPELAAARGLVDRHGAEITARHAAKAARSAPGGQPPVPMEAVLRAEVLVDEMNLANACEDYRRTEELLEHARAEPWLALVEDGFASAFELRLAHALADRERLVPGAPARAAPALRSFLERHRDLTPDDRLHAQLLLARLALDARRLEEAQALLDQVERTLRDDASYCSAGDPTRRAIDHAVLRGRLTLAREPDPAALERALESARAALDVLLRQWSAAPLHDGGLSLMQTTERLRLAESVVDLHLARGPSAEALAASLAEVARVQAVGTLARSLGAAAPSLEDVRATLVPEGGGLFVFLPGTSTTRLFCVDSLALTAHELPPLHRLDRVRAALLRALSRALRSPEGARSPSLQAALAEADEHFFPPDVRARVAGWRRIVIAGMDGIGYLPFELLNAGGDEALGRRVELSYVPSLPVGVWLARERPLRARAAGAPEYFLLAAADAPARSAAPAGPAALPFGPAEQARLLGAARLRSIVVRRGEGATPAALCEPALASAGLLHVIAHTVDSSRPDRPKGLLLADPEGGARAVPPAEIEGLRLPPLVVLTACGAGQGPLRRGDDGRAHFGGAAFVGGARTVVLSYLDVDYQSALHAMGGFLAELSARGASPAAAMHRVRAAAAEGALLPFLVHVTGLAQEPSFPRR